jgi:hypothetical protein
MAVQLTEARSYWRRSGCRHGRVGRRLGLVVTYRPSAREENTIG